MKALGRGTVEGDKCKLSNTLFVPELTRNLLSVPAITDNNGAVLFTKKGVKVLKSNFRVPPDLVIMEGHKTPRGLFIIDKLRYTTIDSCRTSDIQSSPPVYSHKHKLVRTNTKYEKCISTTLEYDKFIMLLEP